MSTHEGGSMKGEGGIGSGWADGALPLPRPPSAAVRCAALSAVGAGGGERPSRRAGGATRRSGCPLTPTLSPPRLGLPATGVKRRGWERGQEEITACGGSPRSPRSGELAAAVAVVAGSGQTVNSIVLITPVSW